MRENLTSSSDGEGLETGRVSTPVPRQSFNRQLLFKEWKSYANLHAFDTDKSEIAEGLIWAAIAAATVKRYLAHMARHLTQVHISTRKVAQGLQHPDSRFFRRTAAHRDPRKTQDIQALSAQIAERLADGELQYGFLIRGHGFWAATSTRPGATSRSSSSCLRY